MALQKNLEISTGNIGNYWRISEAKLINGTNSVSVLVCLWKDAATKNAEGKSPMARFTYTVEILDASADIVQQSYEALKLLDQFQGAIDV